MKIQSRQSGFTLIELIVVIVIIGLLTGVLFMMLQGPMRAFADIERRVRLVDVGETALQRMTREIRLALPNSIRISGGNAIEFLRTLDGGRYRSEGSDRLEFNKQSDTFEFLGPLNKFAQIVTGGASQTDCLTNTASNHCLVVFNTGQPGANAYAGDNIAVITGKNAGASTLSYNISPQPSFPFPSPRQRFFVVDTPVSYVCSGNRITRYSDYPITAGQIVPPGGNDNLLIDQLSGCSMSYDPGTATRAGLVTIRITIDDSDINDSITLLQQAHVDNLP